MNLQCWDQEWRESVFSQLDEKWDLIVIGGGITGAGIFRSAVSAGMQTLLVEAHDFAFGTSSRSSKLVHGGFRYLYNKQYHVTYESVIERQRLLREAPCLIDPLTFNLPNYGDYGFPSWMFSAGLTIYDLMAGKWQHRTLSHAKMLQCIPGLSVQGYLQGFRYFDAVLDDARLVFRIIRETVQDGGTALNYARVDDFLHDRQGQVCGVVLRDMSADSGRTYEVRADTVVNAAGPWSDEVRSPLNAPSRLRPLRGSHVIISGSRLPVQEAVTLFHPRDKRAMFIIPWEGATVVGTTDIDHSGGEFQPGPEPFASQREIAYILDGISFLFPHSKINKDDILSTFSGLRPVIATGAATPSKESRAHQVWEESGLVTVSGGKLTTFRIMARDTLELVASISGQTIRIDPRLPMLNPVCSAKELRKFSAVQKRLIGRSGHEAFQIIRRSTSEDLQPINGLPATWAELKFASHYESIQHLDDLLLRRTRIGMLLPQGAQTFLPAIRAAVQQELGWSDETWDREQRHYLDIWNKYYSPDPG